LRGLGDHRAYIALPVAPKVLFLAAHEQRVIENAQGQNATKLAKQMNTQVIQQARAFVWGSTDLRRQGQFRATILSELGGLRHVSLRGEIQNVRLAERSSLRAALSNAQMRL
jgi:hypothetical protein